MRILKRHAAHLVVIALLAVPALATLRNTGQMNGEQRRLAGLPVLPQSLPAALAYPVQLEAWVNDHFGGRQRLVEWNNRARYALFREFPTIQVIGGKNGRIFLSAHQKSDAPYSAIASALGQGVDATPIVQQINAFVALADSQGIDARVLVVPSSPAVHTADLPDWARVQYQRAALPMQQVLASPQLGARARAALYFPIDDMREAGAQFDVFPKTWFHWSGAGPRLVAERVMARWWGRDAATGVALKTTLKSAPSDLEPLFPGVKLSSQFEAVDFGASGVDACVGPACFGALQPLLETLHQMSVYRNRLAARGRLVLITDSFGLPAAPWYARYYREVVHFSTNGIDRLDEARLAQLRHWLFRPQAHDDVLFLYHDVTVHAGRFGLDARLLAPATVPGQGTPAPN
ncbi:MAG: hypothetical protein V4463_05000 [Pseudomonadota bacterium]